MIIISEMKGVFELEENNKTGIFESVIRVCYLLAVVAIDAGILFVVIFPGVGREQMFERGMTGMLLLIASLIISIPSFLYCMWKLFRGERSIFWLSAFFVAVLPILLLIAKSIFDILTM